jgi:sugar O-acyltransferase (sialic acid O-acetyltransferase NeuD family)
MKNIAIYGAGGSGRELYCVLKRINAIQPTWNFIGFIDDGLPAGSTNEYGEILGGIDFVNNYSDELAIAISIGAPMIIKKLVESINNEYIWFPNIIDPMVTIIDNSNFKIGKGNIIFNRALLSINTTIGDFNFLDNCECGHDATIGNYNVFMTGVKVCGGVQMQNLNFLGINSIILQYLAIGSELKLAANSVIMKNSLESGLYIGNPAIRAKISIKK